jgi:mRNA-degrading endonuclease RelE of RelBE toxin-antitoxin system
MITFDEEMDKLPSERRAKIEAKTQELLQEIQIIDELRQRLGLSSEEITESESEQPCFSAKSDDFKQHLTRRKFNPYDEGIRGRMGTYP